MTTNKILLAGNFVDIDLVIWELYYIHCFLKVMFECCFDPFFVQVTVAFSKYPIRFELLMQKVKCHLVQANLIIFVAFLLIDVWFDHPYFLLEWLTRYKLILNSALSDMLIMQKRLAEQQVIWCFPIPILTSHYTWNCEL